MKFEFTDLEKDIINQDELESQERKAQGISNYVVVIFFDGKAPLDGYSCRSDTKHSYMTFYNKKEVLKYLSLNCIEGELFYLIISDSISNRTIYNGNLNVNVIKSIIKTVIYYESNR